ncbi:lipid droplet assembly factor 1 isoform X1 [Pteropus medius]|uniref:lipid droplet assembly factor 1 isoform X1 n=1 Tax=Pteropus vampyrus TaxID=132908 RepID=UPI00196A27BF|nr:lipid droplet assembly factor 1 isoform X1 [Pteropus giganteus]XP_039696208.1 lipid droplet assembly factor 1 isoform X1 [Pteropus giganteus]
MAKEETPSTSKDFEELQRKLSLLIESIQNNSKLRRICQRGVQTWHSTLALSSLLADGCLSEVSSGSVPGQASFRGPHLAGVYCSVGRSCWVLPAPRDAYLPGCFCGSRFTRRTGHLRGRLLTALCPLWFGLRVARHIRDNHSVLRGGLQPCQLLVFSQTTDAKAQWRLPAGYEAHSLRGALPGMTDPTEPELFPSHLWKAVGSYTLLGILGFWEAGWSSTPWTCPLAFSLVMGSCGSRAGHLVAPVSVLSAGLPSRGQSAENRDGSVAPPTSHPLLPSDADLTLAGS